MTSALSSSGLVELAVYIEELLLAPPAPAQKHRFPGQGGADDDVIELGHFAVFEDLGENAVDLLVGTRKYCP